MPIKIKRIYEPYDEDDGYRIFIDRLYPRGVRKAEAHIDLWLKEIAPSTALRKWFNHDPKKWDEFQARYHAELEQNAQAIQTLVAILEEKSTITLLYATRDTHHNHAIVLREYFSKG